MSGLSRIISEEIDIKATGGWGWPRVFNSQKLLSVCSVAVYNIKLPDLFGVGRD